MPSFSETSYQNWAAQVEELLEADEKILEKGYISGLMLLAALTDTRPNISLSQILAEKNPEFFVPVERRCNLSRYLSEELDLGLNNLEIGVCDCVFEKASPEYNGKDLYKATVIARTVGTTDKRVLLLFECTTRHSSCIEDVEGSIIAQENIRSYATLNSGFGLIKDEGLFDQKDHLDLIRIFNGLLYLYLANSKRS